MSGDQMHDLIWGLAQKVQQYCPGDIGWIAKQQKAPDQPDTWCFVVGHGAACVTEAEAQNADDTLIRKLATQILGFPPDSPQDIERRRIEATQKIREIDATVDQLEKSRAYWQSKLDALPEVAATE